jgi:hypothetical protein
MSLYTSCSFSSNLTFGLNYAKLLSALQKTNVRNTMSLLIRNLTVLYIFADQMTRVFHNLCTNIRKAYAKFVKRIAVRQQQWWYNTYYPYYRIIYDLPGTMAAAHTTQRRRSATLIKREIWGRKWLRLNLRYRPDICTAVPGKLYLTENTLSFHYKYQPVNCVLTNNGCLLN